MIKNVVIIFLLKNTCLSEQTCWKLLGFPKTFLDGFLQSLSFPNDAGVKDVIPGYLCTIDNLGQGTLQYSSGVPWFWSSKSEDLAW